MKKIKKQTIITTLALTTLLLLIVGATYAFFQAQVGAGTSANVNVTTGTTDSLVFETGEDISINATQQNFNSNSSSLSGTSYAKATLKAGSGNGTVSYNYYVYLDINYNCMLLFHFRSPLLKLL